MSTFSGWEIRQAALWLAANTAATGGATLGIGGKFTAPHTGWAVGVPAKNCPWAGIYTEFGPETAERVLRSAISESVWNFLGVRCSGSLYHVEPVLVSTYPLVLWKAHDWKQHAVFCLDTKETHYLRKESV